VIPLPSHAGNGAAESCCRCCCRGDLTMMCYRCQDMLAMVLPSHAGDDAVEATWSQCDVDAKSY
jgi:hypothetical protein